MSQKDYAKEAYKADKKAKRRAAIDAVLQERITEQIAKEGGVVNFTNAFQDNPFSLGLGTILEEGAADGDVEQKALDLYRVELRKFEAAFLLKHCDMIEPVAIIKMLAHEASLELTDEDAPKWNSELLEAFGVSLSFPLIEK